MLQRSAGNGTCRGPPWSAAPGRDVTAPREVQGCQPCSGRQLHHGHVACGAAGQAQGLRDEQGLRFPGGLQASKAVRCVQQQGRASCAPALEHCRAFRLATSMLHDGRRTQKNHRLTLGAGGNPDRLGILTCRAGNAATTAAAPGCSRHTLRSSAARCCSRCSGRSSSSMS